MYGSGQNWQCHEGDALNEETHREGFGRGSTIRSLIYKRKYGNLDI